MLAADDGSSRRPVRVERASKFYEPQVGERVEALRGVSFHIDAGELVGLMGPSGCGKSTLANLIGCIDLPTEGDVFIDGSSTSHLSDVLLTALRRSRIGIVFQFFNLVPTLSLYENIALPLLLNGWSDFEARGRVEYIMDFVGLVHKKSSLASELSGGQEQRAAIARAVVHEPSIIVADEPTGNLDPRNAARVCGLFRSLADSGQAILMATHTAEAAAVCDRIIRLDEGSIVT